MQWTLRAYVILNRFLFDFTKARHHADGLFFFQKIAGQWGVSILYIIA